MVKLSGGSAWLAWVVAVLVTTLIGVLAFSVFVLSKVFGSSSPDSDAAPPPARKAVLVAAKAPVAGRTVIVNGTSWRVGQAGRYPPARTDSSTAVRTT